jgi:hypothetical protein
MYIYYIILIIVTPENIVDWHFFQRLIATKTKMLLSGVIESWVQIPENSFKVYPIVLYSFE